MPDRAKKSLLPDEVAAIWEEIAGALNTLDATGRRVGNAKYGVYAFYDYDGEPIYVGQTTERLRTRIRRHLTNYRTDAVAMNVLDPFEVNEIEMWPFWDLQGERADDPAVVSTLNSAEYTVYREVLKRSIFGAVLNEKDIPPTPTMSLPTSTRRAIVPSDVHERRSHPDVRIARRASTIAALARVISERDVSKGLRRTLLVQAQRLEWLAKRRLDEVPGAIPKEGDREDELEATER